MKICLWKWKRQLCRSSPTATKVFRHPPCWFCQLWVTCPAHPAQWWHASVSPSAPPPSPPAAAAAVPSGPGHLLTCPLSSLHPPPFPACDSSPAAGETECHEHLLGGINHSAGWRDKLQASFKARRSHSDSASLKMIKNYFCYYWHRKWRLKVVGYCNLMMKTVSIKSQKKYIYNIYILFKNKTKSYPLCSVWQEGFQKNEGWSSTRPVFQFHQGGLLSKVLLCQHVLLMHHLRESKGQPLPVVPGAQPTKW